MRIRILILATALLTPVAATAASAVPKVSAIARNSCSLHDFPAPAFEVLIASPGQKNVDTKSPWLRIFFDLEPKSYSAFTFRFDNKYVTVYQSGISPEKAMGSVTFPRIADGKNLKGTFDLQTPAGEHITGQFNAQWQKLKILCGVGPHFPG